MVHTAVDGEHDEEDNNVYRQRYSFCRGCRKQILWVRTAAGQSMPCDPAVITFAPGPGNETFVTPEGITIRGTRAAEGRIGYIPHWATCPERAKFKKGDRT